MVSILTLNKIFILQGRTIGTVTVSYDTANFMIFGCAQGRGLAIMRGAYTFYFKRIRQTYMWALMGMTTIFLFLTLLSQVSQGSK